MLWVQVFTKVMDELEVIHLRSECAYREYEFQLMSPNHQSGEVAVYKVRERREPNVDAYGEGTEIGGVQLHCSVPSDSLSLSSSSEMLKVVPLFVFLLHLSLCGECFCLTRVKDMAKVRAEQMKEMLLLNAKHIIIRREVIIKGQKRELLQYNGPR
ncbi:hypothetical protein EGR_04504 [Echinococcus granulosus]|uniref:Uncharacterized protein n=1 Tax=Echinococcus granulosus TaxID=6210 RepID=W6UHX7_ECHGR|nr:hypothetical protein EGR_04504 [Echinococcus granulosus]EUB60671.1 hypothetical protein EGR_04504 [Echinococcus granulosus]